MTKRMKYVVAGIGLVLVVGVVGGISVSRGEKGTAIRAEEVSRRELVATVRSSGWIRPRRAVEIQADIMGRIVELRVDEGDSVRVGDLLLRIDPTQYEAAVMRAEAAVSGALAREAQTRAAFLQAEQALRRARELAAGGLNMVSAQTLEEAETQVAVQRVLQEAARHDVAQARAALREAQDRLSKTVIRAPISGVVTRRNVEEGEMAIVGTMNNPGSLLLTISDLSVMEAVVRVDETDVPQLTLGDSAAIEIDAFPRAKFAGRITKIGHSGVGLPGGSGSMAAAARNQAIDFEVVITLENPPAGLRPDLSATANIVTATRPDALAIPIIALTVRERPVEAIAQEDQAARAASDRAVEDTEGVFLVVDGKARFTPVQVGIAGADYFEVLAGLAEGDTVVAGPYEAIRTLEDERPVRRSENPRRKGGRS
jgi:HlyD family secretion protein